MYHLDFRPNALNFYNKLVQATFVNGGWQGQLTPSEAMDMNLVRGDNDVVVNVGQDYFKVWVNGKFCEEIIAVDPVRLSRYGHLRFEQSGSCLSFVLEKSYVRYLPGGHDYFTVSKVTVVR
jgi:hypothetical protein